MKVFVSTHPFSESSALPMEMLLKAGLEVVVNPYKRKLVTEELVLHLKDVDFLLAGTERITKEVIKSASKLKLISRIGVGLDGIDFSMCKELGVKVAYTPDAPTMAVAELCLGLFLDLSRRISNADHNMKSGNWNKYMGHLIYGKTVGVIGLGRIGKSITHLLSSFNVKIVAHDIKPDHLFGKLYGVSFVSKEELLRKSDFVSINLPLKDDTYNYIASSEFNLMKRSAFLINTARGGVVNESDLKHALNSNIISGAAIDVYLQEPYFGPLKDSANCILTSHMGAATVESRNDMEIQAAEEVLRYINKEPLRNEVFGNE